jgi:acid phosphatase class B
MVLKAAREKVEKTWTTTKKILAMMSVWGLIFSLVTIARLGVAFTYDDGLVASAAAFEKASGAVTQARSPEYWKIVNNAYDLESPKLVPYGLALLLRAFGFRVTILAERGASGGDALKKEWRHLSPRGFLFVPDPEELHLHLQDGRYVLFFGDGDRELLEAKKAGVYAVRIRRGSKAVHDGEYSPGKMGELVLPLSQF